MIRVATFNAENLFARYRFRQNIDPIGIDNFTINELAFDIYNETAKQINAATIKAVDADIIALQEVENLPVLDRFDSRYLGGMRYKHRILIDALDPRMIDMAVMSRYPIDSVRSYRHERNSANTAPLFSRDCLQVNLDVEGKPLTLYINHFKSMIDGRSETKPCREEQVQRVADIVKDQWLQTGYQGNFIVLGDFNDYADGDTTLGALLDHPGLVDISERLPKDDRWTHFWSRGNEYRQLDFILLSKSLADKNSNHPQIIRKGLPYRAERYIDERFDNVGANQPKASDHCPVFMDVVLD